MAAKRRLTGAVCVVPALLGLNLAVNVSAHAQASIVKGNAAELRILTPLNGEVIGIGKFNLDFSFKARTSPITAVEMFVDGEQWARKSLDIPSMRNVLTFDVDGGSLKEGNHTVMVKIYARNGTFASTEIQVVAAGSGSAKPKTNSPVEAELSGSAPLLAFRAMPSKKVMGTVEIALDVKSPNNQNPYVSFYVDKQFKTLKNYPPYSFIFDTTTVANGRHTIEAMGYLEANNATTTQKLELFVDNAGGNTDRKTDIPDLGAAKTAAEPIKHEPLLSAAPAALTANVRAASSVKEIPTVATTTVAGMRTAVPTVKPVAAAIKTATSVVADAVKSVTTKKAIAVENAVDTRMAMPVAAELHRELPSIVPVAIAGRPLPVAPSAAVRSASGFAQATVTRTPAPVRHSARVAAPKPVAKVGLAESLPAPEFQKLQIAFDGMQIAFDVQPRVEQGMPIAPFRQIFEHTGGQVMWVNDTKTVRALNADREIVIKVGAPSATINGESISLDRKSFIEKGRTIVPLSFVGKALDVNVNYDPITGRLSITSKK